ncbi:MAG: hypothetical protein FWC76_07720 [Defluviitaleaceae bacterium]|nr:hypothetical protein [Defluviitaleaceae bacterium]
MKTGNLIGRVAMLIVAAFGAFTLIRYTWRHTSGFQQNLMAAFGFRGDLSDMMLGFVYPLIFLTIITVAWLIRGLRFSKLGIIWFFLLASSILALSVIVLEF